MTLDDSESSCAEKYVGRDWLVINLSHCILTIEKEISIHTVGSSWWIEFQFVSFDIKFWHIRFEEWQVIHIIIVHDRDLAS